MNARAYALAVMVLTSGCDEDGGSPQRDEDGGSPLLAWQPVTTVGAPEARLRHGAAWTGESMLVWGGLVDGGEDEDHHTNTGGAYDPAADQWFTMSVTGAPSPREPVAALWTGRELLLFGGGERVDEIPPMDGGLYDPSTDTWRRITPPGVIEPRSAFSWVWTGSEMIVWGGIAQPPESTAVYFDSGAAYDPEADSWRAIGNDGAPQARAGASAVWTGTEMFVWEGGLAGETAAQDGGLYDPASDSWRPVGEGPPSNFSLDAIVWAGREVLVWYGDRDGRYLASYDPATGVWLQKPMEPDRNVLATLWTGAAVIAWAPPPDPYPGKGGGIFDPDTDTWVDIETEGAPILGYGFSAVWTGEEMIVWGGHAPSSARASLTNEGGRYRPSP